MKPMSTWTSNAARGLLAAAVLPLAGCVGTGGFDLASLLPSPAAETPEEGVLEELALTRDGFVARGPSGYCIDPAASDARAGFAALAGCGLLEDGRAMPDIDAFVTVQVGARRSATVDGYEAELAALFASDEGAALLSSAGNPEDVEVIAIGDQAGLVTVHFIDSEPHGPDGLEAGEWRAFLDHGTRLITIGVRGFERRPLSEAEGLRLLGQIVGSIAAANPEGDVSE